MKNIKLSATKEILNNLTFKKPQSPLKEFKKNQHNLPPLDNEISTFSIPTPEERYANSISKVQADDIISKLDPKFKQILNSQQQEINELKQANSIIKKHNDEANLSSKKALLFSKLSIFIAIISIIASIIIGIIF